MAENHLRNFQFLRNNDILPFASYADARTAAKTAFGGIGTLQDGEIVLYSYKLDDDATTVHTLLGIKRTNGIEILGNYDELTAEYQSYVASEIAKLDTPEGGVTGSNNGVSVTVTQVDGKINSVSVVAPSLTSAIEALDVDPFSLTTLNGDKLEGYQISEVNGKIVKGQTATTLLTFASEPTATNKVVTQAEITALNADKTSTNGTNVQVQVIEQGGVITGVNVVTDNTVNTTDVNNAITTAIAGLDSTKANLETLEGATATADIRVEVVETDGKLTAVNVTDTLKAVAHSGQASDVTIADTAGLYTATDVENALAEVMGKANDLQAAQLSAGNGIDIVNNKIHADLKLSIANETTGEDENAVTTTYLYIKDTEGNEISKVDASDFVKDGFLQKVEKDASTNELIFTWNTDAEGAGENDQVTRIAISDLCDVYTAKENDWVVLNGFEFSHKTSGVTADQYADNAADVTVNNTTSQSFKVPTLTVDAAGHVTAAYEKTVTIALPASIDTAVQTINGHDVNDTFITTTVTPSEGGKTQTIAVTATFGSLADNSEGFAEATEVKEYVDGKIGALKDYNTETTVSTAENSGIIVTPTIDNPDTVNEQRTYAISLATVTRNDNPKTAGQPSQSSFADDVKTFTYVKAVNTDANGRVTGIVTETVTEDFDAGTY